MESASRTRQQTHHGTLHAVSEEAKTVPPRETGEYRTPPNPAAAEPTPLLGQLVAANCQMSQQITELSLRLARAERRAAEAEARIGATQRRVNELQTSRDNLAGAVARLLHERAHSR